MQTKQKLRPVIVLGIVLLSLAILGVLVWAAAGRAPKAEPVPETTPLPTPEIVVREREVEKIVEVDREITAAMVREELRAVGLLITQEYYFTEVISHSSMLSLDLDLKFVQINEPLPITESRFLASFDGVVTAGVDFTRIVVDKDDETRTLTVAMPAAEILNVDIDPESFRLYDERQGLGTRITVEDYNDAMTQLEATARDKAVARGLLENADENARTVVRSFIRSITGAEDYTVIFDTVVTAPALP